MDLDEFRNVRAGNLSGGNKRKLSCAMTLVLCPKVLFLDEPTTGVDPVSRRSLFKLIKQLSDSTSILLTTHRMDEAEKLCDEITILINGRSICFGSPSYLMQTYGQGYLFTVKFDLNSQSINESDVRANIEESLASPTLITSIVDQENRKRNLKYRI